MMKIKPIVLTILLLITCLSVYADKAPVVRWAFFDIGSGATRMIVADVNAQNGSAAIIYEKSWKIDFKMDLEVGKQQKFSQDIRDKGLLTLAKMKWLALQKGAVSFAAVATSAFRLARNGKAYAAFISQVLGIPVTVISQQEEALMGFLAAAAKSAQKSHMLVVWDIGGGSMQMTTVDEQGNYTIYYGKLASVSFARYIVEQIQGKDMQKVNTPNPISPADMEKALAYVAQVTKDVPQILRAKLQNPETRVLGIGGVHYYSIRNQVKAGKTYSLDDLNKTVRERVGKTDQEIGGKYAKTEVSNLILVKGFMEALGIKTVKVLKVNNAHGILYYKAIRK